VQVTALPRRSGGQVRPDLQQLVTGNMASARAQKPVSQVVVPVPQFEVASSRQWAERAEAVGRGRERATSHSARSRQGDGLRFSGPLWGALNRARRSRHRVHFTPPPGLSPSKTGQSVEFSAKMCAMAALTGSGTAVPRRAPGTVSQTVLVAGATGYVDGRLIAELKTTGEVGVRCLARTPAKLDAAPWRSNVEVVRGSVGGDVGEALKGVDTIVYLVHSIGQGEDWAQRELVDARNVAEHARSAGVRRIVYLGGLGRDGDDLSPHLRSR
jgi:NAD(P)H-binding